MFRTHATAVIPDELLGPLLAGALFLVQVAGPDVLAARAEWRSLHVPATAGSAIDERLADYIARLRHQGRRLPELHERTLDEQRGRRVLDETDPLYRVNLSVIERHLGSGSNVIVSKPRNQIPCRDRSQSQWPRCSLLQSGRGVLAQLADEASNRR